MRVKKIFIRGQIKVFSWIVKLNSKITLTKEKTNKKNKGHNKKIKNWLNDKI